MSKKNKHYQPRHVRSDDAPIAATELRRSSQSRYLNEQKAASGTETAEELHPERDAIVREKVTRTESDTKKRYSDIKREAINRAALRATDDHPTKAGDALSAVIAAAPAVKADNTDTQDASKASANTETPVQATGDPVVSDSIAPGSANAVISGSGASTVNTETAEEESKTETASSDKKNAATITDPTPDPCEEKTNVEETEVTSAEGSADDSDNFYDEERASDREEKEKPAKKKKWKRILIITITIPLVIIIGLVSTFFIMREIGRQSLHSKKQIEIVLPTDDGIGNTIELGDKYGRIITYNGQSYIYNSDVISLTFIGIDNGHGEGNELRMADAIYVFAFDTSTDKVKVLNISRDLITDVDIYSLDGAFINTDETQIAYSNAYHGKNMTGGDNTNKSISRLLFGLPLENYYELNLSGVSTLNDAVGGVTVTSSLTFESPEDGRMIYEGDVVTLHGKEAEYYARRRDITQLESNNDRMKRQQDYIISFLASIVPAAKRDLSIIPNLISAISDNSETSLSASEIVYLASDVISKLKNLSDVEFYKFNGTITAGKNAELRVTTDEVLRNMLEIFYKPLKTSATDTEGNPIEVTASTAQPSQPATEDSSTAPSEAPPTAEPTEKAEPTAA